MSECELVEQLPALIERARQGNHQAISFIIDQYGAHLLRVVRRRLLSRQRPHLCRLFDWADFVQMVWLDFFHTGIHEVHSADPQQLKSYLSRIAANKVAVAERDYLICQKRSLLQQQSLENRDLPGKQRLISHDSSPEQYAIIDEERQRLKTMGSSRERQVLELRQQGMTYSEVADNLSISRKTVQRIVAKYCHELNYEK